MPPPHGVGVTIESTTLSKEPGSARSYRGTACGRAGAGGRLINLEFVVGARRELTAGFILLF